jgi:hypothetical protein
MNRIIPTAESAFIIAAGVLTTVALAWFYWHHLIVAYYQLATS